MISLTVLSENAGPLKEAFNKESDKTRLILLVSPTWGMCRQGASVIQREVLDTIKNPSVRVFIAWVPILASDQHAPDADTLTLIQDKRATHFWDARGKLPVLFQKTLNLSPHPAWDVYLIYPPGVKWEQEPTKPVYWQHQLGGVSTAPQLDGKLFTEKLREVLIHQ